MKTTLKFDKKDDLLENDNSSYSISEENALLGKNIAWSVSIIIIIYLIVLILGFVSLKSLDEPIGNPYFTILEVLIIILAPTMVFSLTILHKSTPEKLKIYSLTALILISIMACITCCLHFVILTLSQQEAFMDKNWSSLVFSFKWPSVAYSVDILAWDFFFATSMLFLSATFRKRGFETLIRILLLVSGVLSLIGILGIPLNNMQVRNIGIVGYTVFAIVVFFLLGIALKRRANN